MRQHGEGILIVAAHGELNPQGSGGQRRLSVIPEPPYWGIENRLRWQLDVSFREDECRAYRDHSPANLSVIRRVAPGISEARGQLQAQDRDQASEVFG